MRLIDADLIDEQELYNCNSVIEAIDYIMEQPTVNQWIPCSERLPSDYQRLIVQTDDGYLKLSRYFCKEFYDIEYVEYRDKQHQVISNVIAWQPLPELYKKEV